MDVLSEVKIVWCCDTCGEICDNDTMLLIEVPHPVRWDDPIAVDQCPHCGEVNRFTRVHDITAYNQDRAGS